MIGTFLAVIAISLMLALLSRQGHGGHNAKDFFVASGQLGPILVFFLSVGETYSVASMLGFPGGIYAKGDSFSAWFFGYIVLVPPVLFMIGPWIWRAGSLYGAATIPDFFGKHFNSRALELLIAITSIALLVPIGTMQLLGLKIVLSTLAPSVPIAFLTFLAGVSAFLYVSIAGLRGAAYVAVLKDVLMIVSIVAVSGVALFHWQSGVVAPPKVAVAATIGAGQSLAFTVSTIVLQSVAYAMIPQTWAFIFSARSAQTFRRSQVLSPLYMVMFPLLMLTANYAITHGLHPPTPDHVFLTTAGMLLPGWLQGIVLAAVALAGLVLLSSVCLAVGPLVTRNVVSGLSGSAQQGWAKVVTAVYLLFSIIGAEISGSLIATLNNVFYFGISQTIPGFVAALCVARIPALAVILGMLAGYATSMIAFAAGLDLGGLNPGLVGLVPNVALMITVTLIAPRRDARSVVEQLRDRDDAHATASMYPHARAA
jgi:SSS family solute:Na+ symporter